MSLKFLEINKNWKTGSTVQEINWDSIRLPLLAWAKNMNLAFSQVTRDAFGNYSIDNDGKPNLSKNLQDQINDILSGASSITGTSNATWTIHAGSVGKAILDTSNLTGARTLKFPDADDTLTGIAASQTLTNKTLSNPIISGTVSGDFSVSGNITFDTNTFYIDATNNQVLILKAGFQGVPDPANAISLPNQASIGWKNAGVSGTEGQFIKGDGTSLSFGTNGFEHMVLGSSGDLIITGNMVLITQSTKLKFVTSASYIYFDAFDRFHIGRSSADVLTLDNNGFYPEVDNSLRLGNGGAKRWSEVWAANGVIQTSDEREKTDIQDSCLGLDFIKRLRPVSYKWKNKKEQGNHYGLIAQEIKKALCGIEFAGLIEEEDSIGLNYNELIAPLIKSVQQISEKIESLL